MTSVIHISVLVVAFLFAILSFWLVCYWNRKKNADPDIVTNEFYRMTYHKAECAAYITVFYLMALGTSLPFLKSEGPVRLGILLIVPLVVAVLLWYYMPQILGIANDHQYFFLTKNDKTLPVKMYCVLVKGLTEKMPALSVYEDEKRNPYLCACVQAGKNPCWIVTETEYTVIQKMLDDEISIHDAVCCKGRVWVVRGDRNPTSNRANCESLAEYMLPEKDVFMMADKNEFYPVLVNLYNRYGVYDEKAVEKDRQADTVKNRVHAIMKSIDDEE